MNNLTPRQGEVLAFIQTYVNEKSYPPSIREIGKAIGLSSSSTVHVHLANLEKKGFIRKDPTKPRTIELLGEKKLPLTGNRANNLDDLSDDVSIVKIPLLGQVAAGLPLLAEENIEEFFPVPASMVKGNTVFMLRIQGDSMQNAGILHNDLVIIRQQNTASTGDIVVALLDDEATIKRLIIKDDHVVLKPENDLFEPIATREVKILGKVTGLFRKYQS